MSVPSEFEARVYPWTLGLFPLHLQCESSSAMGFCAPLFILLGPKGSQDVPGQTVRTEFPLSSNCGFRSFLSVTSLV